MARPRLYVFDTADQEEGYRRDMREVEVVWRMHEADVVAIELDWPGDVEMMARRLKERGIKVVLTSASPGIGLLSTRLGVAALTKPFNPEELEELVLVLVDPGRLDAGLQSHREKNRRNH